MRVHLTAAALLLALGSLPAHGENHTVIAGGFAFSPSRLTIRAGDTVTWINTGGAHNVSAEDGSFLSGEIAPADDPVWPYVHRFDRPGVFPYVCIPHEFHGMRGVVEVEGPGHPGVLEFAQDTFTTAEGEGIAAVTVRRAKGSTGAVSVAYSAAASSPNPGNASPGTDFTPVAGVLRWADGDPGDRSFTVPVLDDPFAEGDEAVSLTLASPTGGATLDPRTRQATLTIAEPSVALRADEVGCDASRLAGLLARAEAAAPNAAGPVGLSLSLTGGGDFAGLAYTNGGPGAPERHLAFSTNPEETTLLRNPERPQLLSVSLTRNPASSDLVPPGGASELRVSVNPTLDPGAATRIEIDNVESTRGREADAKPGRGLASLLSPCHRGLSDRDVHVLRVLTKVARATAEGAAATELALFRGEAPDTYRIDVYPLGPGQAPQGRLAAEVAVTFGAAGELLGGTMRLLERCAAPGALHCTSVTRRTGLALARPVPSGEPAPAPGVEVSTGGAAESAVDWIALLDGTTWRRPL